MYIPRIIKKKIEKTLQEKSVLLFGPRQTGKSSMIREELKPDKVINLLDQDYSNVESILGSSYVA